jgi:ATP/maltotriose-dependent transcriptional regulator MalT
VRANLLNSLGVSVAGLGDHARGAALLRRSIDLARTADSTEDICRGHNNLAFVLSNAGDFDGSGSESMRCIDEARARGVEISAAGLAIGNALESFLWLGRWQEAAELIRSAVDRPFPEEVLAGVHHSAGELALRRGDLALAHRHLAAAEQAATEVEAPQLRAQLGLLRAELALAGHQPHLALEIVERTLAAVAASDDHAHLSRLLMIGLQALNDLAQSPPGQPLAGQGPDVVIQRAGALWSMSGYPPAGDRPPEDSQPSADRPAPPPLHSVEIALARLEHARLAEVDTAEDWQAVAASCTQLRWPWMAAYATVRAAYATLRADRTNRKAAARILDRAETILAQLGEPVALAAEIAALRRARNLPETAPTAGSAHTRTEATVRAGLTEREYDVLLALAEGWTNSQIGTRLGIAGKTVSVHVSHIMDKLMARTRGEAVAKARVCGLLP